MLFSSYEFLFIFLPIILTGFFRLASRGWTEAALGWIFAASVVFYGYWDVRFVPGLLLSILVNYTLGMALQRRPSRALLVFGVGVNLAALGYFKYAGFLWNTLAPIFGPTDPWQAPTLPLGISFFTFTQLAWIIDAYRGEARATPLLHYALFVTFFPHLIAGPILHHRDILPQFRRLRTFVLSHRRFALGLVWFSIGLFKKVVIADYVAHWVEPVFSNPHSATFVDAWVGALGYTVQLYCDFSGYSDMAIGLGHMLNITLPLNFESPYKATSIIDFWRRWHMTLGWFLRRYLYFPLGGNRVGPVRHMVNLFVTMTLCGLWHGAGWTFVLWGALHGGYLLINHQWRRLNWTLPVLPAWGLTFGAVVMGWVLFRAHTVADATALFRTMLGFDGVTLPVKFQTGLAWLAPWGVHFSDTVLMLYGLDHLAGLLAMIVGLVALPNAWTLTQRFTPSWRWLTFSATAALISLLFLRRGAEFLYFQF